MIKRIKDSMVELKEYSSRTKEINIEIQRKIVILNDLLNLCDFISDKTEISKLISMVINKLAGLYVHGFSVAYFEESPGLLKLKCSCNVENGQILRVMDVKRGEDFLGEAVSKKKTIVIDSSTPKASSAFLFKTKFELSNAVIMPVSVMGT
jgi:transcriptional regulator with GAF, ATPase, and Fis domain